MHDVFKDHWKDVNLTVMWGFKASGCDERGSLFGETLLCVLGLRGLNHLVSPGFPLVPENYEKLLPGGRGRPRSALLQHGPLR